MDNLSMNQNKFIADLFVVDGRRIDARSPIQPRPVSIQFLPSFGSLLFSLGQTRIHASVAAHPIEPYPDRPTEGLLSFDCKYSNVALAQNESTFHSTVSDMECLINRMLEKVLRSSRAIDTEGLCIVAHSLVWSIKVSLSILENDGNVLDACSMAAIAALLHFRRPDVTVIGDENVTIHSINERHPVPLSIHHIPISTTFSFISSTSTSSTTKYLVDACLGEEAVSVGSLSICMNSQREICALSKAGGIGMDIDLISHCCNLAYSITIDTCKQIQDLVKTDLQLREPKKILKY